MENNEAPQQKGNPTDFGNVFSTTAKVVGSLFLISLAIGIVWLIVGGVANRSTNSWDATVILIGSPTYDGGESYETKADERHTLVPESQWKKFIAAAIKQHYGVEGMTKQELTEAVGKPRSIIPVHEGPKTREDWVYEVTSEGECLKYVGDTCSDRKKNVSGTRFHFSPNGYLVWPAIDTAKPGGSPSNANNLFRDNWLSEPFRSYYQKMEEVLDAKEKLKKAPL